MTNGRVLSKEELERVFFVSEHNPYLVDVDLTRDLIATIRDRDKTIAELTEQAAEWVKKYTVAQAEIERLRCKKSAKP